MATENVQEGGYTGLSCCKRRGTATGSGQEVGHLGKVIDIRKETEDETTGVA